MGRWSLVQQFLRDCRYGARVFARDRAFAAVAVLTLGLGLGANTAIFTVLYNTLLRPLPYPDADRLVRVSLVSITDQRGARTIGFSYPKLVDLVRESRSFESLAAYARQRFTLSGTGEADVVVGEVVSASYFRLLGVTPAVGRVFLDEEDGTPGTHPVVVLSDSLWRSRFGARPDVIGTSIRLNRVPLTVVGVIPQGFKGESGRAEVWIPMMMAPAVLHSDSVLTFRGQHWHEVIGRLREGVTASQADAEVRNIVARMPDSTAGGSRMSGVAVPLDESKRDPRLRTLLRVLYGVVSLIVLIACANLANLLLARGVVRQREIAVRLSLGASRGAIVRQLLAESLMLSLAGGGLGFMLALWSMQGLAALRPPADASVWPTYTRELDLDAFAVTWPVCLFAAALAVLTTVVFGLVPALSASRRDVQATLKTDTVSWSARRSGGGPWRALIATQVALVLLVLTATGLMLRSFGRLLDRPLGIDPTNTLTFPVRFPSDVYDRSSGNAAFDRLLTRLAALPGVESVARVRSLPIVERGTVTQAQVDGGPETYYVGYNEVDPGFFRTFRVHLASGRLFDVRDTETAPPVAIVSESAAQQLFGTRSPLGHRITVMGRPGEIVGVIADVRYEPQRQQLPIAGDVYLDLQQRGALSAYVAVRTGSDPRRHLASIRRALAEVDPELPLYDAKTMDEDLAGVLSFARFTTLLLAVFGALALSLAVAGVYGTVTYAVASRRTEIAIRLALGATPKGVLGLVLRDGLAVCGIGLAIGLPLAMMSARAMRALLYEVSPEDPLAFMLAIGVLAITATLACSVPARRAARVSPALTLRQ